MIARRSFIPLWISLVLAAGAAQAVTVEQIPNPRPAGWVVDLTGTLPAETVAGLNELSREVQTRTGADLVVVVIPTADGADPRDFATRLFNAWKLGSGQHNSVLVFAALDDRAAEIILGDSLNTETGIRESAAILQGQMVPRFREGDPAGAIWSGAQACAQGFFGAAPRAAPSPVPSPAPEAVPETVPPLAPSQNFYEPEAQESEPGIRLSLLLQIAFLGISGLGAWLIFRKPRCPRCQQKMMMLDEEADDAYLEPSERVEERIESVDHQVWACPACGERKKRRFRSLFSGYKKCPECSARTVRTASFTLAQATYTYPGKVQVDQTCANCSYSTSQTYVTPVLQLGATHYHDDTHRGSASFSSSDSSSSSSSSNSGSSSGGDHSSGGGASGRW